MRVGADELRARCGLGAQGWGKGWDGIGGVAASSGAIADYGPMAVTTDWAAVWVGVAGSVVAAAAGLLGGIIVALGGRGTTTRQRLAATFRPFSNFLLETSWATELHSTSPRAECSPAGSGSDRRDWCAGGSSCTVQSWTPRGRSRPEASSPVRLSHCHDCK